MEQGEQWPGMMETKGWFLEDKQEAFTMLQREEKVEPSLAQTREEEEGRVQEIQLSGI